MKMRALLFIAALFLISNNGFAQVGVNTTTPSNASVLDLESENNGSYGGFLPPRVASDTERDAIPTDSGDVGMLVFVLDSGTLQIWNGINWETVYTLSTQVTTTAVQDFDTNITWNYALNPAPYIDVALIDYWSVVSDLGTGTGAIDFVSGNFLGCRDLDNPSGGGNFFHEIAFVNVDVSGLTNPRLSFDYDVVGFDAGDDVRYEVFYDDVGQGQVILINGASNYSEEGTVTITIPPTATNVRITVGIDQNGNNDFAGFDNFRIFGQ